MCVGSVRRRCVSRAKRWWAARSRWLKSRLKAALCTPAVRSVPEPEELAASGAQRTKPADSHSQSEYDNRKMSEAENVGQITPKLDIKGDF